MNRTPIGRIAERLESWPFFGARLLRIAVATEGGQIYSTTLRRVLARRYGVEVGPYTYGSLLEPGRADRGTIIGAYVSIGPGVRRFGANHPISHPIMHAFAYNPALGLAAESDDVERRRCTIEHDVWIGADVIITAGCERIGVGAVVAAGSVVTHDVADFAVVAGVPAKRIATRLTETQQRAVKDLDFSSITPPELVFWAQTLKAAKEAADRARSVEDSAKSGAKRRN